MLFHGVGARNQSGNQSITDAMPSRGAIDINGMLHRIAIAIPWPERAERRVAEDVCPLSRDEDWVTRLLALREPCNSRLQAGELVVPYGSRAADGVVIDSQDAACVGF